jgi:alkylation response protein AidB-like acyl-CoA dehydrogenase
MELTGERKALRDAVRDAVRRNPPELSPPDSGPGYDPALWRLLCEIGVAGLAVPDRYGGAGAGPVEVNVVAEELGRLLAPTPLLGSAVLATQAILATDDTDACERLMPEMISGRLIAALAWTGADGGWDPAAAAFHAAARSGGGWTLTGAAHYVLNGDSAGLLVAAAARPAGGLGLFEVDPGQPGVDRHAAVAMDQTRRLAVVRLASAADRPLGPETQARHGAGAEVNGASAAAAALARARDLACIALSAEQAGAAARALELTVGYTSTRVQFGRPIAGFQAIQHRLAEMHVLVESARALSYRAAEVADAAVRDGAASAGAGAGAAAELPLLAAAAKAYCSEALATVAGEMIQLHGAIGITWEHDAHRYFKRAHGSAQLFGPPSAHLATIAAAVLDS